jgi:branched-chain amino acid transport system permease protein
VRELVQTVVYGLTIGSVYALVACGYSVIFATTRIVNFAQGPLVVVGGYLAWWLYTDLGNGDVSLLLVTLAVVILTAGVGVLVDLVAVAPLGRFDPATNKDLTSFQNNIMVLFLALVIPSIPSSSPCS